MLVLPLSQVAQMQPGSNLEATCGRVTKIGDYKRDTKQDGSNEQYSFQKIHLTDGAATMMVKIWDRDAIPNDWKGQVLYLLSTSSGNNRMNGLKIKEETYRGTTTRYINVTEAAELSFAAPAGTEAAPAQPAAPAKAALPMTPAQQGEATANAQLAQAAARRSLPQPGATAQPAQPAAPATPPPAQPPAQPAAVPTATLPKKPLKTPEALATEEAKRLHDVKVDMFRRGQLMGIAKCVILDLAEQLKEQRGIETSADQQAAWVSSIFISGDRDKLHYQLPATRLDLTKKQRPNHTQPPANPEPPATA